MSALNAGKHGVGTSALTCDVLEATRQEIRLLETLPASQEDARVMCRPHTVSLLDKPIYSALSYAWGDATLKAAVFIDGIETSITSALAGASTGIQQSSLPKQKVVDRTLSSYVWTGGICINQSESGERSQQVTLLAKIYKSAHCVISWLGHHSDELGSGLRTIA